MVSIICHSESIAMWGEDSGRSGENGFLYEDLLSTNGFKQKQTNNKCNK